MLTTTGLVLNISRHARAPRALVHIPVSGFVSRQAVLCWCQLCELSLWFFMSQREQLGQVTMQ